MARDRGVIKIDLWADDDWRDLSRGAQWLYFYLLSCPSLSYAGVADWRPNRIAPLCADSSTSDIELAAKELAEAYFIVYDNESEEVLIRSYLRHDDLLSKPNVTKAMTKAFTEVSSKNIRGVIVHELQRLQMENPEGFGKYNVWGSREVQMILKSRAINPKANPSGRGSKTVPLTLPIGTPNPSVQGSPTTATATATSTPTDVGGSGGKRKPERPLPDTWTPKSAHYEYGKTKNLDIENEAERFRLHAQANDRRQRDWDAGFRMWLTKAQPQESQTLSPWSKEFHQ